MKIKSKWRVDLNVTVRNENKGKDLHDFIKAKRELSTNKKLIYNIGLHSPTPTPKNPLQVLICEDSIKGLRKIETGGNSCKFCIYK